MTALALRALVALPLFLAAAAVRGETSVTEAPPVRLAAATAPASAAIRFRQIPAVVGDRVEQRLAVDLELVTKITQSGQIAHESTNPMRRQQHRVIEVLEVSAGRAVRARATFPLSRRQSPDGPEPDALAPQPIEGKSYLLRRDGEQLVLTDLDGHIPPEEQFKLAMESLENVGKPNPLAALLVDRSIAVGQRLLVPRKLVQQLLGFDDPVGAVRRFELTLDRVLPADAAHPAPRAVFQTRIEVVPDDDAPLEITLAGDMIVETTTCRLTSVELRGPVRLDSIERTPGGIFQYTAGGELNLNIQADYSAR